MRRGWPILCAVCLPAAGGQRVGLLFHLFTLNCSAGFYASPPQEGQPSWVLCATFLPPRNAPAGTGGAAEPAALISLARPINLWQAIHHGKQRQRQARSKETKEDHTQTPPGTPRRRPNPHPHHQKSRRVACPSSCCFLDVGWPILAGFAKMADRAPTLKSNRPH